MLIGGDGGIGVSYDMAKTWVFEANLPVGLFYHVGYDMEIPYNVCGGMQDNYDWCGPSATRQSAGILNSDWFQIATGDGFVSVPDLNNSKIIYTETQDGNMQRRDKVTGESKSIRPNALNVTPAPEARRVVPLRVGHADRSSRRTTTARCSSAANKVFKSTDRGDSWTVISPDLTSNANRDTITTMGLKGADITVSKNDGVSQWPAIVTLAESHRQAGRATTPAPTTATLSVSRDGGKSWQNMTKNLPGFPAGGWVSRVAPSRYDAGNRLRHGRQPPSQRLRDVHLGEQRLRRIVPLAQGEPDRRDGQDDHGRPAEPGRALPRHRDGHLPLARSRQELVRA